MLRIILLLTFVIFIFTIMTHELVKVRPYTSMLFFVIVTVAIVVLLLDNAKLNNAAYGQSLLFPSAHNSGLINSIKNNKNNNSLMRSLNSSGSHTKKSNLATSNAAHFNNSRNNKLINPIQRFGVPITHVPFVVP